MQKVFTPHYSRTNREVIKVLASLVEQHPSMKLIEILEKYNIAEVDKRDVHTNPDKILARTYLKIYELGSARV